MADSPIRRRSRSKAELAQEELRDAVLASVERRRRLHDEDAEAADEIETLFETERPILQALPDD